MTNTVHVSPKTVAALDIGGTGSRGVLALPDGREFAVAAPGVSVGAAGVPVGDILGRLAAQFRSKTAADGVPWSPGVVAIGMSGLLGLSSIDHSLAACRALWPEARIVLASDAVTALAAAIGSPRSADDGATGGAIVSAGTGVIGFGTDWVSAWHRADGWGHVLGDDGGGAWIGRAGIASALRAYDGRGGSQMLLELLRVEFGDPEELPRAVYTRDDRSRVLASFAEHVAAAAVAGDGEAAQIWETAGRLLAVCASAVLAPGISERVALIGGIVKSGDLIVEPFLREAHRLKPSAEILVSNTSPLDGALQIARDVAAGVSRIAQHAPYIYLLEG